MLADRRIDVSSLSSHRFPIDSAAAAYQVVGGSEPSLGILLEYPETARAALAERTVRLGVAVAPAGAARARLGFIGSGNYAMAVLIPAFKASGAALGTVASNAGVPAVHAGRKFGFEDASTDTPALLADPRTNAVVISTRHDSHAALVLQALAAGKHVFVEKPLCLTHEELARIEQAARAAGRVLMVGFNRRFAPQIARMRALLAGVPGPKAFVMTVNAGAIPANHWTQDPAVGGGRIVGEACHFIDLLRHLAGSPIAGWTRADMASGTGDTASVQLSFEDGSIGTVHYFANGSKAFPKERLEVFAAGRVLQLDHFRRLTGHGWPGFRKLNLWRQDKGQRACAAAFVDAIERGTASPIALDELIEVSRITIDIAQGHRC
jgi:predicted dehydrogenase